MENRNGQALTVLPVPMEAMRSLIETRKDLVVKIGNNYEISRPLALELWKLFVQEILKHGGSIKESTKVEYASTEMVIVSLSCTIRVGESEVSFTEIGEAYAKEKGKEDTLARTAYTRAMKRLLERIAGEDFINRVILSLFPNAKEVPATDRQKELIKRLVKEGRITKEMVEETLGQGFNLNQALKENKLTYAQAKNLLDKALGR